MPRALSTSVAVITGASSGIGRATALRLAAKGATVVVAARRSEPLDTLVESCRQTGADALAVPLDVTDAEAVDDLARRAAETFGRLDIWVNNAAVGMFGRLEESPLEDIRRVVDVDLMGYVHGARAAVPWMREQGAGVVINVGSILSHLPAPHLTPYVVSKAAVAALTGCLRAELRDAPGVTASSVLPGPVDTPFFQHAANHSGRSVTVLRPTYAPERVARAIVSCARLPRREVVVGSMPRASLLAHRLAPGPTERVTAWLVTRDHFTDEPAEPTSGNLHEPVVAGMHAEGGWGHGGLAKVAGAATGAAAVAGAAAAMARARRAA